MRSMTTNPSYETPPNEVNIRTWLENLYQEAQPVEQSRWQQSNIDTLFYAGSQDFVNKYFNFAPNVSSQSFHFNLIQQPVNMVTGYQRQHRRSINYLPTEGSDPQTCDQYTRMINNASSMGGINEAFSKGCELATVSGMVLLQPYLDFTGDDPAQGNLKLKLWEYNSFIVDPYFREPDLSDANYVWCQEYISRSMAKRRFPEFEEIIDGMRTNFRGRSNFYFLPEQQLATKNRLLVLSYVWYRTAEKRKRIYSRQRNQFFDMAPDDQNIASLQAGINDLEIVETVEDAWHQAIVLNDKLVFEGPNPLGIRACPFVPIYWNYDPHITQPDLRVRSLVRCMRDTQFLLNRRIILNHDISESSINSGWVRKIGAVANEENLKKTGQGWDVIINEGYEISDAQKIIPNAVPPSDLQLADQLTNLIYSVSGVNNENWAAQEQGQVSSLTVLLKQGANLMVLQKYFDQWDYALQLLGERMLQICLSNWSPEKVELLIGEDPTFHFYNKVFAKYKVSVAEGLDTAVQRQQEFQQTVELNQILGGIIPPSYIASIATLQGKTKLMEILSQQEQAQAASAQQQEQLSHAVLDAQLQETYARATAELAQARERAGRAESNVGLFEERLSEITHNRAMATKAKMEALEKLIEVVAKYGEIETALKASDLQRDALLQEAQEDREKIDAKQTAASTQFVQELLMSRPQEGSPSGELSSPEGAEGLRGLGGSTSPL